jgi:hypothetical protein
MAAGACAADDQGAVARAHNGERQQIIVTRSRGDFKPDCGPRQIGRRLRGLSEALHVIDKETLQAYWGAGFQWFRILHRDATWFEVESYEAGIDALHQRGGLRLRFRKVEVGRKGGAEFDATFWKSESVRKDIAGKVQLSCKRPTIVAVSAFNYPRHEVASCPKPRRPVRGAMIVCSRR